MKIVALILFLFRYGDTILDYTGSDVEVGNSHLMHKVSKLRKVFLEKISIKKKKEVMLNVKLWLFRNLRLEV